MRLSRNHNIPVFLHWIPSHVERTMYGIHRIWGNYYADVEAEHARKRSQARDTVRQTTSVRENTYAAVLEMLETVNVLLEKSQPDGPSSQEDDFDAPVDASQGSSQELSDT